LKSSTERIAVPVRLFWNWLCVAVVVSLFAALTPTAGFAEGTGSTPVGRTETLSLSTQLVRPFKRGDRGRHVVVYLPAGYGDPANILKRYAVIYLLHGSPGNPLNFLNFGSFPQKMEQQAQAGAMQQVIFVIPDGNYAGERHGDGEWADSADRRDRFETWITKEIVPFVDGHYRTRPEPAGRYLAGVSEGGFGSVNLALRNPKVFGGAVGLSGYYDMRHFGWGHIVFNDSDAAMSLNSPLFYVPDRVASGRIPPEWKNLKIFLGSGAEESPYADHTRQLGDALKSAGMRQVYVETPEGKHDWNLWSGLFFKAMSIFLPPSASKG